MESKSMRFSRERSAHDPLSIEEVLHFISGPISWSFYFVVFDDGTSKKFHFFGDKHFDRRDNCESLTKFKCSSVKSPNSSKYCYDIVYFLEKVFEKAEKSNTVVDLFLEVPYLRSSEEKILFNKDVGYLKDVLEHFSDCFSYKKTNCKFKNTRFHYVDIRLTTKFISNEKQSFFIILVYDPFLRLKQLLQNTKTIQEAKLDLIIGYYVNIISKNKKFLFEEGNIYDSFNLFLEPGFRDNVKKFLDRYEKSTGSTLLVKDKLIESVISGFGKRYPKKSSSYESIIYVQLEELRKDNILLNGKNIASLVKDFLIEKFRITVEKNVDKLKRVWDDFLVLFNYPNITLEFLINFLNDSQKDFDHFFIQFTFLFMDAYTLPRMFRKYSTKKENSSSYSITFAGDLHIQIYQEFFESYLLSQPIANKEGNPERCIYDKNMQLYTDINFDMDDISREKLKRPQSILSQKIPKYQKTLKKEKVHSSSDEEKHKRSKYKKSLKTEETLSSSEDEKHKISKYKKSLKTEEPLSYDLDDPNLNLQDEDVQFNLIWDSLLNN